MGPDVLIHTERINAGKPFWRADPAPRLDLDAFPQRSPGDTELMGQGGDGSVVTFQRVSGPPDGTVGQNRPSPGQGVLFAEDLCGAMFIPA